MTIIRNALLSIRGNVDPNKIWVGEIRAGRGRLWETVVSAPVEMAQAVINRGGVDFGLYRARVVELRQSTHLKVWLLTEEGEGRHTHLPSHRQEVYR